MLATPLMIALILACVAAIFRICRRRRIAIWIAAASALIAYLGALPIVGDALLRPLEHRYPPLREYPSLQGIGYVMVLGSGYEPRDGIPVTAALEEDGLVRILEGIRLTRRLHARHLIVSGGARPGHKPSALGYAELARTLGIGDATLIVLDSATNTYGEGQAAATQLGVEPVILVTSAYHMPRAMELMRRFGVHALPAPTGQTVRNDPDDGWRRCLPTSMGLRKTERALHEYLGLVAQSAGMG